MKPMNFEGKRVLVTGASSGLGAEMAEQLARDHKADLVLVARRRDRLEALAERLQREYGVNAEVIAADLSQEADASRVFETATQRDLYAAILNAGITHFGHWDELSWEEFQRMQSVNITCTVRLTTLLLPYLEERGENGGVLLVASLAGITPVAYQAAYAGTKAFLVNYGCSLHHEMKARGVTVSVFAPGGIATEMTAGERFNDLRLWLVEVGPCAATAIKGFRNRAYLTIPGLVYRWGSKVMRLLSEEFLVGRVAAQYRNSLRRNSN